jgi:hypothetical protein
MNMATVFDNSEPVSIMRRHRGMISVDKRKLITSELSFCLTKAPMTPREVRRRYSNGRFFEAVFRKGYRKRGICACCQLECVFGPDWTDRSKRVPLFRCDLQHIARVQEHCTPDSKHAQST